MAGPQRSHLRPFRWRLRAHLVSALTSDTMPEIAEKVAVHSVGRRLPARWPDGTKCWPTEGHPDQVTLGELVAGARLPPLSWFDVRWRE